MKTTQLLKEWKSFLLNEHKVFSLNEIIQTILQSNRSEEDVNYLRNFWNSNRFIKKYTQVIQNELKNTQEPIREILDVCKLHYEKIYQSAGPKIKDLIGGGNITIDEIRKQIDFKSNTNKSEVRRQCAYQNGRPVVGKYDDFDVVYSEADYIVIEPKTIQGSIAWAHGKPDGSEETDQKRRVGWCTGVTSGNNMFPNYAGNLHMFYILNTDYDNDKSANRRLCLSFTISEGEAIVEEKGGSTVDASNRSLSKSVLNKIKAERYYQDIIQRLQGRKETSFTEMYSKCTLSQFLRLKAQMEARELDESVIIREINNYAKYSIDVDLLAYILDNDTPKINRNLSRTILRRDDLTKLERSNVLIKKIINSRDDFIKATFALRDDLLDIDPSGQLIKDFVNSKNESIRANIAYCGNLYVVDPTGGLTKQLASDEDTEVRANLAQSENLLNSNPSNTLIDVIKQLASDEDTGVRIGLASQKGLFREDLISANYDFFEELLTKLANDDSYRVRAMIARKSEWFIVDSNQKILNLLANDDNVGVRDTLAGNSKIFDLENFEIIHKILLDPNDGVVKNMLRNIKNNTSLTGSELQTIFSDVYKKIYSKVFDNFKNTKFNHKTLSSCLFDFYQHEVIFIKKDIEKLYKLVIKKINEGFSLSSQCMQDLLYLLNIKDALTEKRQLVLAKLIRKSDFVSQKFFLQEKGITKKAFAYVAKKVLPKKGRGPSQVYSGLARRETTYLALQDPEVARIFATMASTGVLRGIFKKITGVLTGTQRIIRSNGYELIEPEEAKQIVLAAAPVLYRAIQNSHTPNALTRSRINFEKLLKQKKIVESKQRSEILSEEDLRKYIQLILT